MGGIALDLRLLNYFLAVVREENISRAAEMLHVTQPTLSRQMSQLEEIMGQELFVRGKHLQLTEAGMILRHRAEEVVQLMDRIKTDLAAQDELAGIIRIGCGGQKSVSFLLECLDEFHELHPRVTYDIFTNNADNIKEKLERGLLDFGVLLEPVDISQYDYLRLKEKDSWGIFMQAESPLASKKEITLADLQDIPIVTTNRLALSQEIRHWFGRDFDKIQMKGTYNIITNVASLVASGKACALTIDGAVALYNPNQLVFRPLSPSLSMTSVLAWKKFKPGYGLAGKFLNYFQVRYEEKYTD